MFRRISVRSLCVSLASASALAGCGEAIDLQPSIAIVYGTVLTPNQEPVLGVAVWIYARPLDRCGDQDGWHAGTATTGGSGRYRAVGTYVHVSRETMCVEVRARPPASGGFTETVVTGDTVVFIHQSLTPPVDSVRVDVVLSRAGG